jgi:hypothetical protein
MSETFVSGQTPVDWLEHPRLSPLGFEGVMRDSDRRILLMTLRPEAVRIGGASKPLAFGLERALAITEAGEVNPNEQCQSRRAAAASPFVIHPEACPAPPRATEIPVPA